MPRIRTEEQRKRQNCLQNERNRNASQAKRNASRKANTRTKRDADGVPIALDTDEDGPLVIPTSEKKQRIKNSLSASMFTKQERACMVCDVMIYGFDELLIESFPGIIMIYSNIRTFITLYAQNSYLPGRPTCFIKSVLYNST
jgi:hypothetical protein